MFLAVSRPLAFKTNGGYECLFTCLPAELASSKKSHTSAIDISTENGAAKTNLVKLCTNKLCMVSTLQMIVDVTTCCNRSPTDVQIATSG